MVGCIYTAGVEVVPSSVELRRDRAGLGRVAVNVGVYTPLGGGGKGV